MIFPLSDIFSEIQTFCRAILHMDGRARQRVVQRERVLFRRWLGLNPVIPQLCALDPLDASPKRGDFMRLVIQLSCALNPGIDNT